MKSMSVVLLVNLVVLCDCTRSHLIQECSTQGFLRVGAIIPSLAGVSDRGEPFHSRDGWTNLTIYSVAASHPPLRVDTGEAVPSQNARKMGARLVRSGDGVVAGRFGMKVVSEDPFRYDTAVMVLCDTNCRVLRIWRSAGVEDLDGLLEGFEVGRTSNGNQ